MKRFTDLYLQLDATNASAEKTAILTRYFETTPAEDAAVALFFLAGKRLDRTASTNLLKRAILNATGFQPWLLAACHEAAGDLSETIALLHPPHQSADEQPADEPLHVTFNTRLTPFERTTDEDEREQLLLDAWRTFDADQRFVFHKLIRGGFRVGAQRKTVANALAAAHRLPVALVTQRLTAKLEPTPESYRAITAPESTDEDRATPLPFCLANPLDTPIDADTHTQATTVASALGDRDDYLAEWKYDGIRCQLIKHDHTLVLWSRGEELITHQFPEITAAARRDLPQRVTLDGEILLTDTNRRPLPFAELQTRLNRKPASLTQPSLFDDRTPAFIAYDILRTDNADLRDHTTQHRRQQLEHLLTNLPPTSPISISPLLAEPTWHALAERRAESRERAVEGLMLKHRSAPYHAGRTREGSTWWKWKTDPLTIDAVLLYAQPGTGRRASLYTDYTFALNATDPDTQKPTLVTFAKAYSGLSNDEIEQVDRFVRNNTVERTGPVRRVTPHLVFELAYESVQRSDRHAAGVAVRFPRILRRRHDKQPEDADTLDTLLAQLRALNPRTPS